MSYKSHQKSPSRAFDHLYDLSYKSSVRNIQKMNYVSLHQSAPLHVIPCYSSMFTDLVTKQRNFYFPQRNPLPLKSDVECSPRMLCDRAVNTNSFILTPKLHEREEIFQLEIVHELPRKSTRSIKCQTKYRESTSQTEPWLPDARLSHGELCIPEIMSVNCTMKPGLREIEAIERARQRRDWEKELPMISKSEFPLRIAQLEAFEWENIIAREREMNENQWDRMEQVVKMIDDRKEIHESISNMKLDTLAERCLIEAERKKSQIEISHQRRLRKLEQLKNENSVTSPKIKPSVTDVLKSRSDTNILFKSSSLPNKSWRVLWKPKKIASEISQGFRNEKNLKSLYETIVEKHKGKNRGELRCRTRREGDDEVEEIKCEADDLYLDYVNVQRMIKGRAIENILNNGMRKSTDLIWKYWKKFPIDCVCEVLPEKQCEVEEETLSESELKPVESLEVPTFDDFSTQIRDYLSKLVNEVVDIVTTAEIRRLLRDAELERSQRRDENHRKQMEKKQRDENQRKIDERRQKIANKIMEEILPCVVDTIAESDAKALIREIAEQVDDEAFGAVESESEVVRKLLREFVIPEVVKRVEKTSEKDEELVALIAAHDTFEFFVENLPFEDIYGSKIICEELVENILNRISRTK